jgi:hypothetical protein
MPLHGNNISFILLYSVTIFQNIDMMLGSIT